MSYYKIINGIKYDKLLLEIAIEFTTGEDGAPIQQRELQLIVKLAQDGGGVTACEHATLRYIRRHFSLTEAAATWFDIQFPTNPTFDLQAIIQKIVVKMLELPRLEVSVNAQEALAQQILAHNKVSFEEALYNSLLSILKDGSDVKSPRSLVENLHKLFREKFISEEAWDEILTARVRDYLNDNSRLALHPLQEFTKDKAVFLRPVRGECSHKNWIFQLDLPRLSSHPYWAITDRNDVESTYHYGCSN